MSSDKRKHERKGSFIMMEVGWLLKSKQRRAISHGALGLLVTLWALCKDSEPATTDLGYNSHKQMLHCLCGFLPSLDPDEIEAQLNELLAQNLVSYTNELRNVLHVHGFRRVHAALNWSGKKGRKPKEDGASESRPEADYSDDDDDRQQFGGNSATIRRELPNNSANIRVSRERVEKSKEEKNLLPRLSVETPLKVNSLPVQPVPKEAVAGATFEEQKEAETDEDYIKILAATFDSKNGVGRSARKAALNRKFVFDGEFTLKKVADTPQEVLLASVLYVLRARSREPAGLLYSCLFGGKVSDSRYEEAHRDVKKILYGNGEET